MSFDRRELLRYGLLSAAGAGLTSLLGCGPKVSAPASKLAPVRDISGQWSLRAVAAEHRLLTGFAVDPERLKDHRCASLVKQQASIIVPENAMKWGALRPARGRFRFDQADTLLTFAEENHIRLRGHTLCWHRDLPAWVTAINSADDARNQLVEHIQTVVSRYAGRMHSWDVVNEAVEVKDNRPDGLRNSPWLQTIGPDYIELAFQTARMADPAALLSYNDYGMEDETYDAEQKRSAVLLLLRRLKARNVPIDAVGIQSHICACAQYGAGLQRFMARVREMGLQIFLSEMDVKDREVNRQDPRRDTVVAQTYSQYLNLALAEPAVSAVLFWGVDDGQSWLRYEQGSDEQARPLLFDRLFLPKEAFYAVRAAMEARSEIVRTSL
ncbi:endo-1,4-beta-xylanase [Terriglobus tenax]|uniref:endo-1,4-beta-xylanase n=1 Tax=Terriglobus tenax TaxID=1111115 RepID=UPI0021DFE2B7|nr:endo-1,4-beta-xylanase [Terriglobus tenax]